MGACGGHAVGSWFILSVMRDAGCGRWADGWAPWTKLRCGWRSLSASWVGKCRWFCVLGDVRGGWSFGHRAGDIVHLASGSDLVC